MWKRASGRNVQFVSCAAMASAPFERGVRDESSGRAFLSLLACFAATTSVLTSSHRRRNSTIIWRNGKILVSELSGLSPRVMIGQHSCRRAVFGMFRRFPNGGGQYWFPCKQCRQPRATELPQGVSSRNLLWGCVSLVSVPLDMPGVRQPTRDLCHLCLTTCGWCPTVLKLAEGIDVSATELKIAEYKRQNQQSINENRIRKVWVSCRGCFKLFRGRCQINFISKKSIPSST